MYLPSSFNEKKMEYQKFIDKHAPCFCIHYNCEDYYRAKQKRPHLVDPQTEKVVPTPAQVIRAIAKKLSCDTAVQSHLGGGIIRLLVADKGQFLALIGKSKEPEVTKSDGHPCAYKVGIEVRLEHYVATAKALGLM